MKQTRLSLFVKQWSAGCGSELCKGANRVHYRGRVPADVLFVGEAPGMSEDSLGKPFMGPAGKILDHVISKSLPEDVRWCITNVICCIPWNDDHSGTTQPDAEDIDLCRSRLEQFIELVQPKLLVTVGSVAKKAFEPMYKHTTKVPDSVLLTTEIEHPAAILRQSIAFQGLSIQRCVAAVEEGWEHVLNQ